MGVYSKGEFTDELGVNWKIEVHDTTYSGTEYTMQIAGNGFEKSIEGITDKPLFTPIMSTKVTVKILVTENDGAILGLIVDLPTGLEDQYYMLIYRETDLWFAGMILTDISQYDDKQRFVWALTATDGINRLANFDFPIDDIATEYISELDAIRLALSICGIERFFEDTDYYIASAINWHEVNAARIKTSLVETRISKYSFIDDQEKQTPKRADTVIKEILSTYGAQLIFEAGLWRITQLETHTDSTIAYEYYGKLGNLIASDTESNEVSITSGVEPLATIVNSNMPSCYGTGITIKSVSEFRYGVNTLLDAAAGYVLSKTFTNQSLANRTIQVVQKIKVIPLNYGSGYVLRMHFNIRYGDWAYGINNNPISSNYGKQQWYYTPTATGFIPVWCDIIPQNLAPINQTISLPIWVPAYLPDADLTIETIMSDTAHPNGVEWYSEYHTIGELTNGQTEHDLSYVANNTTYNAASIFNEETLAYCDDTKAFGLNSKQIYTGTDWQPSAEWASGTSATSGITQAELLCSKSVFWQRYPRLLIQGSIRVSNYHAEKTLVWRGIRFVFLTGSYVAQSSTWTGVWMELTYTTTGVLTTPRNPYRDTIAQIKDKTAENSARIDTVGGDIQQLILQVQQLTQQVTSLKMKDDMGIENQLIQNIDGTTPLTSGQKQNLVLINDSGTYKLKYDSPE